MKLDYSIESPEERKQLVEQIIAETPDISPQYLEILANYLIYKMEQQEKKEKKIMTDNRLMTINKRETSFEGLAGQLENGEDGIYSLMVESDKNVLFKPKIGITAEDLAEIPLLKQLHDAIEDVKGMAKRASGKQAALLKKNLIEMHKDQYIIKQAYRRPIIFNKLQHTSMSTIPLEDQSTYNHATKEIEVRGITLMDPKTVSAILCNYSRLKEDSYDRFSGDTWYLIQDFDNISAAALEHYPLYERLVTLKIDGVQNAEIQLILQQEFGIKYSLEYISALWRNKIPKLIAAAAQAEFYQFEYLRRHLPMKKCTKCGKLKPRLNFFFSKNSASKDNLYSICKDCRNKKS